MIAMTSALFKQMEDKAISQNNKTSASIFHITCYHVNFFIVDLHKFLDDSARKLQSFFDSSCGFRHIQEALYKHKVEVVSDIESLRNLAGTLCGISADSLETGTILHSMECFLL